MFPWTSTVGWRYGSLHYGGIGNPLDFNISSTVSPLLFLSYGSCLYFSLLSYSELVLYIAKYIATVFPISSYISGFLTVVLGFNFLYFLISTKASDNFYGLNGFHSFGHFLLLSSNIYYTVLFSLFFDVTSCLHSGGI